jgi:hypothetical protein
MFATYCVAFFAAGFSALAAIVLITTVSRFDDSAK